MSHFSQLDLLSFLDTLVEQNTLPKSTVDAQRSAVLKVLSHLSDEEKKRLTENLDLKLLYQKFQKFSSNLTLSSIKTYEGRFKTAFKNYIKFSKNPSAFKPRTRGRPQQIRNLNFTSDTPQEDSAVSVIKSQVCKFMIATRPDVFAHIELPSKLSKAEANRINEFVIACTKSLVFEDNVNE